MRKRRYIRYLAILLALCFVLSGCANPVQPVAAESEDSLVSGRIVLTDPEASRQSQPYRPESPSADDGNALDPTAASQPEQASEPPPGGTEPEFQPPRGASSPAPAQQPSAASQPQQPAESASPQQPSAASQPQKPVEAVSQPPETAADTEASRDGEDDEDGDEDAVLAQQTNPQAMVSNAQPSSVPLGEVRGVWISYLEMETLLKGKSGDQFAANIGKVFDDARAFGLNTVFVHVRPFGDALYESDYFPWSYTITGTEGKAPGFDPLAIMVEYAHARGLRIEAWLNPYRVRAENNNNALSAGNQAQLWLDGRDDGAIRYNGSISYNPASAKARELIVNGAREIVRKYGVDGIHIDDYFYPYTDAEYDSKSYNAYKSGGGTLSLENWRRQNVEELIRAMYAAIKAENPNVLFGISPQSSVYNNYNAQYLDVAKISSVAGYCDYICPQIYFGFENGTQPFRETLESWGKMVNESVVELYVGLAVYKCGAADSWAGAGKNEWISNTDLLRRMVELSRAQSAYSGFILYRYDSMFKPASAVSSHIQKELNALKSIL